MSFKTYLSEISAALKEGNATEHTHRPALKSLIESLSKGVTATNEPKRVACGAPDYIVTKGPVPIGYLEAKDVGKSLDEIENDEQLKRYRTSLRNLILTDYLEFRYFRNGEPISKARIARVQQNGLVKVDADGVKQAEQLFSWFFQAEVESIGTPRVLAEKMAAMARMVRDLIEKVFTAEDTSGELHAQFEGFKQVLLADLTETQFADMYAQTICYGLFAARCNHIHGGFTREAAAKVLPKTNPFLRRIFQQIAGIDLDDRIAWAVDDLALLLARADLSSILEDFGKHSEREDPVVHFYETFLAAYDPKLREMRGVYYTPEPVVSYIVRSVDAILRNVFDLASGLADSSKIKVKIRSKKTKGKDGKGPEQQVVREFHRVQILDPAAGTGTFLYSIIGRIRESFLDNAGMWPGYVAQHLLPRLYGFELLIAPYAVAHLKLDLQLKETGYDFNSDERLRVYLTNTLEEAHELTGLPLFAKVIAEEASSAGEIKRDAPIMVIVGNPPYSGESANAGKWIYDLLHGYDSANKKNTQNYFLVDGKSLNERNTKWLNDDYVKFIRFSQWRIEQTGYGILALITNHGYLDNPTFRGMRQSLMESFDDIYLLDLHGNSKKKERSPDGGIDKNVFDIQQGVAVGIFIKRTSGGKKTAAKSIRHSDLFGTREKKYEWLWDNDISTTPWTTLVPKQPYYFFRPLDESNLAEYETSPKITEIFPLNTIGIITKRDSLAIAWSEKEMLQRVREFAALPPEEARERFDLPEDVRDWSVERAQADLKASGLKKGLVTPIQYRPFDVRYTFYTGNSKGFIGWPFVNTMRHLLAGENVALITSRMTKGEKFAHVQVARHVTEVISMSSKTSNNAFVFPLYCYPEQGSLFDATGAVNTGGSRTANIAPSYIELISKRLKLKFVKDGRGDLVKTVGPEDIFNYVYAVLHSPAFRKRYEPLLAIDFPRIPLTTSLPIFRAVSSFGRQLAELHLFDKLAPDKTKFPVAGSNKVLNAEYVTDATRLAGQSKSGSPHLGRIYINGEQYFEGVPLAVWQFQVGGYQVCHKWLRDRKGRSLSFDDLKHYQRVIAALAKTLELQSDIDSAIPKWPLQ